MTARSALILAGTGMLRVVARELAVDGWQVVLPSRRHAPLPVEDPELRSVHWSRGRRHTRMGSGRAIWVEAHWDRPRELARKAERALVTPAELLVAWVHESYRRAVLGAVEPLLAESAAVVEVRSLSDLAEIPEETEGFYPAHPTQHVLLGSTSDADPSRPLGHEEIGQAVLYAVHRALEGRPSSVHQVGERRPVHGR